MADAAVLTDAPTAQSQTPVPAGGTQQPPPPFVAAATTEAVAFLGGECRRLIAQVGAAVSEGNARHAWDVLAPYRRTHARSSACDPLPAGEVGAYCSAAHAALGTAGGGTYVLWAEAVAQPGGVLTESNMREVISRGHWNSAPNTAMVEHLNSAIAAGDTVVVTGACYGGGLCAIRDGVEVHAYDAAPPAGAESRVAFHPGQGQFAGVPPGTAAAAGGASCWLHPESARATARSLVDVVRPGGLIVMTGLVEGPDTRGMHAVSHELAEQHAAGRVTQVRDFVVGGDGDKPVRVLMATVTDQTNPESPEALADSVERGEQNAPMHLDVTEVLPRHELVPTTGSGDLGGVSYATNTLTVQSHHTMSRFRNACVYMLVCPTVDGGVVYVGATTNLDTRLKEHVTGKGCRHLFNLLVNLLGSSSTEAERMAFLEIHILCDLPADVADLPALLDTLLGPPAPGSHHTTDGVKFVTHHFEAKVLDALFFERPNVPRLNRHIGAFGHGTHCYAHVNGALGGPVSSAVGADDRAGTRAKNGTAKAMTERGAIGGAVSSAVGADGRVGTRAKNGTAKAMTERGAIGGAASSAVGADGRVGTGAKNGTAMSCGERAIRGLAMKRKTAAGIAKLRNLQTGEVVTVYFYSHHSNVRWLRACLYLADGRNVGLVVKTSLDTEFAAGTLHPRPYTGRICRRIGGGFHGDYPIRTHIVVEAPCRPGGASPRSLAASVTTPPPQPPAAGDTTTATTATTTPAAPTATTPAEAAGTIRAFFGPRTSSSTEGDAEDVADGGQ